MVIQVLELSDFNGSLLYYDVTQSLQGLCESSPSLRGPVTLGRG